MAYCHWPDAQTRSFLLLLKQMRNLLHLLLYLCKFLLSLGCSLLSFLHHLRLGILHKLGVLQSALQPLQVLLQLHLLLLKPLLLLLGIKESCIARCTCKEVDQNTNLKCKTQLG